MKSDYIYILSVSLFIALCGIYANSGSDDDIKNDAETTNQSVVTETTVYNNEKSKSTTKKETTSNNLAEGEFWCMGKNDKCKNKTYSATDLYCYSCDPDNNNIEGDQRTSDGKVGDNNGNGRIDTDDWEKEWEDTLDAMYDKYGV